jgi:hypothetical protein
VRKPPSSFDGFREIVLAVAAEPFLFLPLAVVAGLSAVLAAIVWFAMR